MTSAVDLRYTGAGSRADYAKNASGAVVGLYNGNTVTVKNSAGDVSKDGTAAVAAGAVTGVSLASTVALVTNGDTKTGVTGSGTIATISVADGVISGIALSSE
jgi:hypothetical protein